MIKTSFLYIVVESFVTDHEPSTITSNAFPTKEEAIEDWYKQKCSDEDYPWYALYATCADHQTLIDTASAMKRDEDVSDDDRNIDVRMIECHSIVQ